MLQTVYYIIDADAWKPQERSELSGIVALRLDLSDDQVLQTCFRNLQNSSGHFSFCLCLTNSANLNVGSINDIISFFFFRRYYNQSKMPVVLLEDESQKGFETFSAALQKGAVEQGYKHIQLVRQSLETNYNTNDLKRLHNDYNEALKSLIEKSFYIAVSHFEEIRVVEQLLQDAEEAFAKTYPAEHRLQTENKTLRQKVAELKYQLLLAEQEIEHMAFHMNVLRSSSQAGSLQQYYNLEYEVLPRWYKQLGHVIKVVQGKRTLSSLFDKKAKKYRS